VLPIKDYNPTRHRAWVTLFLIAACIVVYFLVEPVGRNAFVSNQQTSVADAKFTLSEAAIPKEVLRGRPLSEAEVIAQYGSASAASLCEGALQGQVVQIQPDRACYPRKNVYFALLVSMFLHGSLIHIGGNMLFLWIFGNNIEDRFGRLRYLIFYLVAGVVATGAHIVLHPSSQVPVVGASGAIAGVMGAYFVLFPNVRIRTVFIFLLIFIRDIQAKWLLLFWLASQFLLAQGSVAWTAHVGGFAFGALVALIARGRSTVTRRRPVPAGW
jgi:membrane associated rhomboid family serine protease